MPGKQNEVQGSYILCQSLLLLIAALYFSPYPEHMLRIQKKNTYTGCVRKNYTILFVICKEILTLQPLENYTTIKFIFAAV